MEPAQLAKTARASLATALNTLQASDDVPDELIDLAEPIAKAMAILHKIERSGGTVLEGSDIVLRNVRTVLEQVQATDFHHPAVDTVLEAVAASLGKVRQLARAAAGGAPQPAPAKAAPAAAPAVQEKPAPAAVVEPKPAPQPVLEAKPAPAPQPTIEPKPVVELKAVEPAPAPQPVIEPKPVVELKPEPKPVAQPAPEPAPRKEAAAPAPQPAPAPKAAPQPTPAPTKTAPEPAAAVLKAEPTRSKDPPIQAPPGARSMEVELGTHSASNFYKGLGGNDVIEHGGIFVATYRIPKLGSSVHVRVLLPGDYEFQATTIVQWTREAGGSSEPGFGARFTQIGPEGRQLVYRYARNREPMFYDDL